MSTLLNRYMDALAKAGCEILAFKEFGSYQGTWLAFVKYSGEIGIVEGAFGSCSYCDSFQSEFDYYDEPIEVDGKFYRTCDIWEPNSECTKQEFEKLKSNWDKKLSEFGKTYLIGGLYDKSHYLQLMQQLSNDDWFDMETKNICEWAINQNWTSAP